VSGETKNLRLRELVRDWVEGWALSRAVAPSVEVPEGFFLHVGRPDHVARYVLPNHDPPALRDLAQRITTPHTWLKICAPRDEIVLPQAWVLSGPEFLMATPLRVDAPAVPSPYALEIVASVNTIDARLLAPDGEVAARGRIAIRGAVAVVDQVETDPAHRRRGLGRVVMQVLCTHASMHGASRGVLVATPDGLALYQVLGWTMESPITAAVLH